MRIDRVRLQVGDVPAAGRFFAGVLDLPVRHDADAATVSVGCSELVLSEGVGAAGNAVHHLAFDVPASAFAAHRDRLAARVPLLAGQDGATEFEGPPGWSSRSVYFEGPDRMVLELIARRNRPEPERSAPFALGSINEVGVAVADVPRTLAALRRSHGVEPFQGTSDDFAPVGDEEGLLILVADGRPWFPTQAVVATPLPLVVEATVPGGGGVQVLSPLAALHARQRGD